MLERAHTSKEFLWKNITRGERLEGLGDYESMILKWNTMERYRLNRLSLR